MEMCRTLESFDRGVISVFLCLVLCMLCASLRLCTYGSVYMHLCVQELQEHSENGHVSLRDEAISGMCAHTRTHACTHTRKHMPIHTHAVCKHRLVHRGWHGVLTNARLGRPFK